MVLYVKDKSIIPPALSWLSKYRGRGWSLMEQHTNHDVLKPLESLLCLQKETASMSKSLRLGGVSFEPLRHINDMQDSQKRGGRLSIPFRPTVGGNPVSKAPKDKYEVGADHGTAKHKTRSETWGRPDSLCFLSSHSKWARLQETCQLQTKCWLKRSSQVLGWDRQHLPPREGKD